MKIPAEAGQSHKERRDQASDPSSLRRPLSFVEPFLLSATGVNTQGENGMGASRFFGLDAIEWSVTLADPAPHRLKFSRRAILVVVVCAATLMMLKINLFSPGQATAGSRKQ
jgi:hypothetical protein